LSREKIVTHGATPYKVAPPVAQIWEIDNWPTTVLKQHGPGR